MAKIFVYSIERPSVLGINDWVNDSSGRKMKKTKVGRATDSLMAMYSPKVGGLANYISYTPYIDPETGIALKDEKGHDVMLQAHLEKKWNKPEGYYTNRPWMRGDSMEESQMTFFQRQSWTLNDGCTIFDTDTELGELGYYMCLGSSKIANSEKEFREHKWPKATHYIALEGESERIKYQKNTVKLTAFASLASNEMTPTTKRKFVHILELASTRSKLTDEQVDNLLYKFIEDSSFTPGSNIDKFNGLYNLLATPLGRETIEARYILREALDARVIYEKQGSYKWPRAEGEMVLGDRYSEAVEFILDPRKTIEVEELQKAIKAKNNN